MLYRLKEWIKQMFVYPPLMMVNVDYDEYWKAKRGKNMGELSDWQIERAKFVISELKNEKNISISDIGCGEGGILNFISKKIPTTELFGSDISEMALERIREFGIKPIKLDIGKVEEFTNIPQADYQILFEILEHVPHSEKLLNKAYEKSNKGVFFSFPNTGFFVHRFRLFFGKFPLQWKLFPGEHVRYWTRADLLWWLKNLGYKKYIIHYYKGMPILNIIWPSLFAAAFVVHLKK